ncbi:MAG: trigger factor [candidate division WOR-3 bacterium]
MEYNFEQKENWHVILNISFTNEEFLSEYKRVLQEIKNEVKIDGFRPGKVPENLIESKYKTQIEEETEEKLVQRGFLNVLKEKEFHILSRPVVSKVEKGIEKINFVVEFDIYPEIEIKNYDKIKIDIKKKDVDEEMIQNNIKLLKNLYAKIEDKEGEIQIGDIAIVDLSFKDQDGKEIEDLSYKDFSIELTEGEILPVFIENLKGKKQGDKVVFDYQYPEDYQDELLKGKKVTIGIDVKQVKRKIVENDDEIFAKNFGFESFQSLKDITKKRLENDINRDYELEKEEKVINYIIEQNPFDPPKSLVQMHLESILNSLKNSGRKEFENDEKLQELYLNYAVWRAKREIILTRISLQENIKATEEEIQNEINKIKQHPNSKVREMADDEGVREEIEKSIIYNKAMDLINSRVEIV